MRNRLTVTLALTAILSFGGLTLASTPRAAKPQNTNTAGSPTTMTRHKSHKASQRKHRRARTHRKAVAAANANR